MALSSRRGSPCVARLASRTRRSSRARVCRAAYEAAADPVVSTAWLAECLDDVSVLDVRGQVTQRTTAPSVEVSTYLAHRAAYLEGHIPGAVFWDWTRDGIDLNAAVGATPVPAQLAAPDELAAALESRGVSSDRPVVVYDAGDGMLAARLWWTLTVAGHPHACVLEGGWAKWLAEGRPTELYEPCPLKIQGVFDADPQQHLLATLDDVRRVVMQDDPGSVGTLLLDTRSPEQFAAAVRRGPRAGRIPSAVSLPRAALLDADTGWFAPLEQQARLLREAGVALPSEQQQGQQQRVIAYCNGGVAAATAALALHRLGHRRWAIYDGSWNEYAASDLPVELPASSAGRRASEVAG